VRVVDKVQTGKLEALSLPVFAWSFAFGEAESARLSR
jgi:hypothetical protein